MELKFRNDGFLKGRKNGEIGEKATEQGETTNSPNWHQVQFRIPTTLRPLK